MVSIDTDDDPDVSYLGEPRSVDSVFDVDVLPCSDRFSRRESMVSEGDPFPPLPVSPSDEGVDGMGGTGEEEPGGDVGGSWNWSLAAKQNSVTRPVRIPNKPITRSWSERQDNNTTQQHDNIAASDMRSPSNVSRSAPKALNYEYVLYAEVEGDM